MRLFRDLNCLARLADLLKNRYTEIGRFFNSLVSGFSRHAFCWYTYAFENDPFGQFTKEIQYDYNAERVQRVYNFRARRARILDAQLSAYFSHL